MQDLWLEVEKETAGWHKGLPPPKQIQNSIRIGMALNEKEKQDIIAYIKSVNHANDPGGYSLLGLGPTAEGVFIFAVVMSGLVGFAIWLGAKS